MINNNRLILKVIIACFLTLVLFSGGCSKKGNLTKLSPKEIVDLYHTASGEGNYELLRQITYFPPNTTEVEINKKIGYDTDTNIGKDTKALTSMIGVKVVSHYEKILNENTAEVGICVKTGVGPLSKLTPVDQIILRKDDDIWKVDYSRNQLTQNQLIEAIKKDSEIAWPYYYMGMSLQSENPYKAYKFYKKYCKLEPDGFFVSNRLQEKFARYENISKEEQRILEANKRIRENSDGQLSNYLYLCQLFIETGDYVKAKRYFTKAEDIIKKKSKLDSFLKAEYERNKEILQSRMEGNTDDPLDKLLE